MPISQLFETCLVLLRYLPNSVLNVVQNRESNSEEEEEDDLLLPQDMMMDILSRLPIRTVMRCKCVCKSWHDLVESPEYGTFHLSKSSSSSSSGLTFIQDDLTSSDPYAFADEVDVNGCGSVSYLGFPHNELVQKLPDNGLLHTWPTPANYLKLIPHSSANGLLLLYDRRIFSHNLFICNPITGEYFELPPPPRVCLDFVRMYGFGTSRITGQYKVVMMFSEARVFVRPQCEVYTLGAGTWRSPAAPANHMRYIGGRVGAFLNGRIHWLACDDLEDKHLLSCFDLETHLFSTLSVPRPCRRLVKNYWLSALEGRLCLCDNSPADSIVIWFMTKYGDDTSWTKEFVISTPPHYGHIFPIKVFKDGDMLFAAEYCAQLCFYSTTTETMKLYDGLLPLSAHYSTSIITYTPTLLSLKTIGIHNSRLQSF